MTRTAAPHIHTERVMYASRSTLTRVTRATVPMIKPILAMTEPTALPKAIPESPIELAVADTTSSGIVVAKLTIVPPMTMRDTRRARDIWMAESTNR